MNNNENTVNTGHYYRVVYEAPFWVVCIQNPSSGKETSQWLYVRDPKNIIQTVDRFNEVTKREYAVRKFHTLNDTLLWVSENLEGVSLYKEDQTKKTSSWNLLARIWKFFTSANNSPEYVIPESRRLI